MKNSTKTLGILIFMLLFLTNLAISGSYVFPGNSLSGSFGAWGGTGHFYSPTFNVNATGGIDITYYDVDLSQLTNGNTWTLKGYAEPGVSKSNSMTSIDPNANSIWCNLMNMEVANGVDWNNNAISTLGPDNTPNTADDTRHGNHQDWYRPATGGKTNGPAADVAYNNESYLTPNPRFPVAPAESASVINRYDFRLRILPTGTNTYTYEMWVRKHNAASNIEGCAWCNCGVWNHAINNCGEAGAWRTFANGGNTVFPISNFDLSSVYVFMGLGNGNDPASQSLTWGRIEVTGTRTPPSEVWVNDDYDSSGTNDGHLWGYDAFDNIQDGVIGVVSGGLVHVAAGTYTENVVINKHLTLSGSGVTTIIQPPLKPSGTGYGIEIMKEGSGPSVSDHTIIKDLRVTGAYNGVTFHWYEDYNYPNVRDTISHVTLQNLQCDHNISEGYPTVPGAYYGNEGDGVRFEKYANYRDILIDHLTATDNAGFGINSESGVSSNNDLTITGGYFARNVMPGFEMYYGSNIIINGAVFVNNGIGFDVEGDIVLTNLNSRGNGNLSMTDVTITGNGASTGIRISGGGTLAPAGTITMNNVTINGTQVLCPGGNPWGPYPSAAIVLSRYTDVSNVHFTNVNLNSTAPVGLFLGTIFKATPIPALDLTGITFNGTYGQLITLGRHGNNPSYAKANVNVDARNAIFTGLTDNFAIEDKITHKLDDASLGLVTWVASNVYVTPASGSIQRGIDAVTGSTVNVAAGLYDERIIINKSLTLKGATNGVSKKGFVVPPAYAYDPLTQSIIKPSTTLEQAVVQITADNVVFDGFVVANEVCQTGGVLQDLVEIAQSLYAPTGIQILNNVLGPNTNTSSQDGTKGRSGLCVLGPSTNTLKLIAKYNKIFDSKGNGCGLMIVGPYGFTYHGATYSNLFSGSVIQDNEITGNHRSGIEFAGGVQGGTDTADYFKIKNNLITSNGWFSLADKDNLKYGHGIMFIRGGSDRGYADANGSRYISIQGNEIKDNEKSGYYFGTKNKDIFSNNNLIQNNGLGTGGYSLWDGVRVDLDESYYASGTYADYGYLTNIPFSNNSITGNGSFGFRVIQTPTLGPVGAENNWWGSYCGPYHPTTNPRGVGNAVSDNVDYRPWCNSDFSDCALPHDPLVVWVNDDWTGSTCMDSVGGHLFGVDAFNKIQDGIDAVASGGTVNVLTGTYNENIVIAKPLSLLGVGRDSVVVYPAISDIGQPNPEKGPSFRGSQMCVVQASNVTIDGFTFDGDSPTLTPPGTIDARNGIITNYYAGDWSNLKVKNCTVKNVYFRGIYASAQTENNLSGVDFNHNIVSNVKGSSGESVGLMLWGSSGNVKQNDVSDASTGIFYHWYSDGNIDSNNVTTSELCLGVNSNDAVTSISYNTVTSSKEGIQTVSTLSPANVTFNTVTDCTTGVALYGGGTAQANVWDNNIKGLGYYSTYGVWASTNLDIWGLGDLFANLKRNTIKDNFYGIVLNEPSGDRSKTLSVLIGGASADRNFIYNNTNYELLLEYCNDNQTATYNYWGKSTYAQIEEVIYHKVDQPDLGLVTFGNAILHGDVNLDGQLSVADVVYLVNYLFKGGPAPQLFIVADVNRDGKLTVADVIYLINYLFKGGPAPKIIASESAAPGIGKITVDKPKLSKPVNLHSVEK